MRILSIVILLYGCSALNKPDIKESDCAELMKTAAKVGCKLKRIIDDEFLEKCDVECK